MSKAKTYIERDDSDKNRMTAKEFLDSTPPLGDDFIIIRDNTPPRDVDYND